MEFSTPLGCPSKNPIVPSLLTFSVSPTVDWAQRWRYRLTDPTYSFLSAQVTRVMKRVTLATQVFPIRLPRPGLVWILRNITSFRHTST